MPTKTISANEPTTDVGAASYLNKGREGFSERHIKRIKYWKAHRGLAKVVIALNVTLVTGGFIGSMVMFILGVQWQSSLKLSIVQEDIYNNLQPSADLAIPLFQEYRAASSTLDEKTKSLMNSFIGDLVTFKFLENESSSKFSLAYFNSRVIAEQPWDDEKLVQYKQTIRDLVSNLKLSSTAIDVQHKNEMTDFSANMYYLNMNAYLVKQSTQEADAFTYGYAILPFIGGIISAITVMSIAGIYQRRWIETI